MCVCVWGGGGGGVLSQGRELPSHCVMTGNERIKKKEKKGRIKKKKKSGTDYNRNKVFF